MQEIKDKTEFEGDYTKIRPNELIKENEESETAKFFLVLAAVYNDLKSITLYSELFKDKYKDPSKDHLSTHLGNYSGIEIYIRRLIIGTLRELFKLVHKNKSIIRSISFQLFEKNIRKNHGKEILKEWDEICQIAFEKFDKKQKSFVAQIANTRDKIISHYDQEKISEGFIENFYKQAKNFSNEFACYSIGRNMNSSRFYYADAAIEGVLKKELIIDDANYYEISMTYTEKMNRALMYILKAYLENKQISK